MPFSFSYVEEIREFFHNKYMIGSFMQRTLALRYDRAISKAGSSFSCIVAPYSKNVCYKPIYFWHKPGIFPINKKSR